MKTADMKVNVRPMLLSFLTVSLFKYKTFPFQSTAYPLIGAEQLPATAICALLLYGTKISCSALVEKYLLCV